MTPHEQEEYARLRKELIGQLRYLIDEVESLKGIVQRVPVKLQEGRPLEGDLSVKETYGLLAAMDEEMHQPFVEALRDGREPQIDCSVDDLVEKHTWNDWPIKEILNRLQEARGTFIDLVTGLELDEWHETGRVHDREQNVFDLAHFITQHDVERLREIGYRLHESSFGSPAG